MYGLQDADKEKYLRAHIEERYSVRVASMNRLDRGVFNTNLGDGRRWIVRVFPARRPIEQVAGDAAILRFLEKHGFPAERCIDADPVSVLYGCGILITEYIEGTCADSHSDEQTLHAFGEMLGQLNTLPVEGDAPAAREAGALHHYALRGGGPANELAAAASWLAAIEDQVPKQRRALYDSLRKQVADADTCHDLPEALIHPDPVLKNVLVRTGSDLVLIDWTGAGQGPRIASLAILIWSGALTNGGWSPARVDALVAGYRSHVQPTDRELLRLGAVLRIRPLVFACWRYRHTVISEQSPDGTEWWWPSDELTQAVAARACAAFQS